MDLLEAAKAACEHAYAPYSGFQVGAALRTADGRVFSGCNVENAAYPEGTCAEAGAIAAMVAGGARTIEELVVYAVSETPVSPCGGCRQKIAEFARSDAKIVLAGAPGGPRETTIGVLLPGAFGAAHLADGAA